MTHLDEGTLRAWLDGELTRAERDEVAARLASDSESRETLERLRDQRDRSRELLEALDVEAPTERVRSALQSLGHGSTPDAPGEEQVRDIASARSRHRDGRARWALWSRPAQAAAMVLLLTGAAAAAILPGSPVRQWLSKALAPGQPPPVAPAATADSGSPNEAALYVRPTGGRLRVELVGVPAGAEIQVELVPRDSVAVHAPEGSDFDWDQERGLARATVSEGPIRLELPDALSEIDLTVDDRVYMLRRGGLTDYRVDPTYRSGAEIRFRVGS